MLKWGLLEEILVTFSLLFVLKYWAWLSCVQAVGLDISSPWVPGTILYPSILPSPYPPSCFFSSAPGVFVSPDVTTDFFCICNFLCLEHPDPCLLIGCILSFRLYPMHLPQGSAFHIQPKLVPLVFICCDRNTCACSLHSAREKQTLNKLFLMVLSTKRKTMQLVDVAIYWIEDGRRNI